jgi:cytochrome b561/polyisoprenoid-binding protein YceI
MRYSAGAIVLHWLVAFLIVALIVLGWRMDEERGADQFVVFQLHKSLGISVLLLTLVRIAWRVVEPPPAVAVTGWQARLARVVHASFYVLLIALPLTGWLAVSTSPVRVPTILFGQLPWPDFPVAGGLEAADRNRWHELADTTHEALGWLLYPLLLLHVAGALRHHFAEEHPSLARMVPGAVPKRMFEIRLMAILAGLAATAAAASAYRATREIAPPVPPPPAQVARADTPAVGPALATSVADVADEAAPAGKASEPVPAWTIGTGSSIGFKSSWSGSAINGGFKDWTAEIRFSLDTGSVFADYNEAGTQLPTELWFDAPKFPRAVFTADKFESLGGDRYRATGTLSIKGVSQPLSFPFTLKIAGNDAVMEGAFELDRTAFGVGAGEYSGTDTIPAAVAVTVKLNAKRAS